MSPQLYKIGSPADPMLRVRGLPSVTNAGVRVRTGFGDLTPPGPRGQPPSPLGPYDDRGQVYNPPALVNGMPNPAGLSAPPSPSASPLAPVGDWYNPTTYATFPLNIANIFPTTATSLLAGNSRRNSLIIQNQSTATSPDIAPTFYVDFNQAPTVGGSLALPPGFGFYWSVSDCPPRDTIYIVGGPFSGPSVVVQGCAIQGTYSPLPS